MSAKSILQVFDRYQNARVAFVQSIADLATWQSNIKFLEGCDVIALMEPLIDDKVIAIRRTCTIAAGRLAEKSVLLAGRLIDTTILSSLLKQLPEADVFFKRAILHFIRGIARHNEELAAKVVEMGVLNNIVVCLEDFDLQVKENAAWAAGLIGRHNEELTSKVIDSGALKLLVLCLQQPEICLKQIVCSVLEDLAHYQAQDIIDEGALPHIMKAIESDDLKLKKCALGALAMIALSSEQAAEKVVEIGALNIALMIPSAPTVKLIRNIVKHSPELAQLAVDMGVCGILAQLLSTGDSPCNISVPSESSSTPTSTETQKSTETSRSGSKRISQKGEKHNKQEKILEVDIVTPKFEPLPPISPSVAPSAAALGYIAAQSDQLALAVIASKAVPPLVKVLCEAVRMTREDAPPETSKDCERWSAVCAAAWALGHISQHSPQHSEAIAATGCFPIMLHIWKSGAGGEEVKRRVGCALRMALQCCLHRPALEPLLHTAPSPLLETVLTQYAKILPQDPRARRLFVTTGALQRLQELPAEQGSHLQKLISVINACFPEEIVKYYSPGFPDTLLERIDNYTPQIPELFIEHLPSDECTSDTVVSRGISKS